MGQQQLLLIMLTIMIVAVAIAVGIALFSANALEQKRNEVINECTLLASEAQRYYRRPTALGGGGKSFTGWSVPSQYSVTEVGSFVATTISGQGVTITGTDSIKVEVSVTPITYSTTIIN